MAVVSDGAILVVNAGSTSTKLHLVGADDRSRRLTDGGRERPWAEDRSHRDPPSGAVERAEGRRGESVWEQGRGARAVAHRVVHGGPQLRDPVLIDEQVMERILQAEELAPLHNQPALRGIESARQALPQLPQVAVFDTGFHHTIPPQAGTYALPRRWREQWGVRRYGFHGLSVAWCALRVPELLYRELPEPRSPGLRLVVCHLGGGCSVSAVKGGRSLDTTMGFSPLEGVPMATRAGSVDAGALLYVMRAQGLSAQQLEHALNFDSGLRGLAGSGDMAQLERAAARGDRDASLAIEVFCHRVAGAVAAMAASADGVDVLAFTAGIGEHSPTVRERVCRRLRFLGVEIDVERNASAVADCTVSADGSTVCVLVIEAREELVAARATRAVLDAAA